MKDLLAGVRVIEAAVYGFVPAAGAALADCGADVIKIEHPRNGDPVRHLSTYGINPGDGGVTTLWECFNRGKKSLAMDISTARGREILLSLVDDADVFITSMMQPARARLGIDADQLMARNPRLIYGRGTGQGPLGPDADKGGFDGLSYWSRPGVSTAASPPDYDFPVLLAGPAFGDVQSGMNLAGAILGALYRRERTGTGGVVDVSLFSSGLWAMQASIAGCYATGRQNIEQLDRRCPPNPSRTSTARVTAGSSSWACWRPIVTGPNSAALSIDPTWRSTPGSARCRRGGSTAAIWFASWTRRSGNGPWTRSLDDWTARRVSGAGSNIPEMCSRTSRRS
jgi:crotonobetainyl-CoA:carnitine CoA-transferase CaiB-like acyl-CoA transferase